MVKKETLIIPNKDGIHARPSAAIVKEAQKHDAEIIIRFGSKEANARNIMEILTLGITRGSSVELIVRGGGDEVFVAMKELLLREYNFR